MKNRRNYYRILQVQPDAPLEIIRASYHALMRVLRQHPDLGGSSENAAVLNEAYETLSNPDLRAAYDRKLDIRNLKRAHVADRRPAMPALCPVCRKPLARKPLPGERCATCRGVLQSKYPADFEKAESRSIARIRKECSIIYYATWRGKPRRATMLDFSPNGTRFLCAERLDLRTTLKLSCDFFEASATVTNLREEQREGEKLYSVGVSFIAIRFSDFKGTFLSTSA